MEIINTDVSNDTPACYYRNASVKADLAYLPPCVSCFANM